MRSSEILIIYVQELRSAVRERSIVLNSVLLPIFLYPVMFWVVITGLTFAEGLAEGARSRVTVYGLPAEHREILDSLRVMNVVEVVEVSGTKAEAEARLARGELDLVAEFLPPAETIRALPGNFEVSLVYDRSLERSRRARQRVEGVVERYRERWLSREARGMAISRAEIEGFRIARRDVATQQQLGTRLLSETLPLFLVVMVALGCFIPAIDTTAGERERSTWETTLTVAASRGSIIAAKYLYVATLGCVGRGTQRDGDVLVAGRGDEAAFLECRRSVPIRPSWTRLSSDGLGNGGPGTFLRCRDDDPGGVRTHFQGRAGHGDAGVLAGAHSTRARSRDGDHAHGVRRGYPPWLTLR